MRSESEIAIFDKEFNPQEMIVSERLELSDRQWTRKPEEAMNMPIYPLGGTFSEHTQRDQQVSAI